MSLAEGMACDGALLETLKRVLDTIPPSELEDYARSTPSFLQGGFRSVKAPLVRARLASMLASSQPVDERLRAMLRDQVRRSLQSGGGGAALRRELDFAKAELAALRGANARLEKEKSARVAAENKAAELRRQTEELLAERGQLRQSLERLEAERRRLERDVAGRAEAQVQIRLAEEFASFFARHSPSTAAAPDETTAGRIARAIGGASPRRLSSWRMAVDLMASGGALTGEEAMALHGALLRAYGEAMAGAGGEADDKDADPGSPEAVFASALAGRIPAVVVIDAHNAMFALQSRYRLPGEHRWPTAQTREWFGRDIAAALDSRRNMRAYVVFDGPTVSESTAGANVKVMYSGGEGEHRADGVIVDLVKFLADGGCRDIIVVTNDGELRGLVARGGAKPLAPTALLKLLPA